MILILSSPDDPHIPVVAAKVHERGSEYIWFDPAWFPGRAKIQVRMDSRGVRSRLLCWEESELDLGTVTAVWYRRPGKPQANREVKDETHRLYCEATSSHLLEGIWQTLNCLWLPAIPATVRRAENKLLQLSRAGSVGFTIPATLITNNPSAFLQFYNDCEAQLVSKSLNDTQPSREGAPVNLYTHAVCRRDAQNYFNVRYAPEIFQKYVPKQKEVRVTAVGTQVFAAEIESQHSRVTRHDWRHYDDDTVAYRAHELPPEIRSRCLALLAALDLAFGAIDLVLTPDGDYVFLEINPNGQWGWIEDATGLAISDGIADLLTGHFDPSPRSSTRGPSLAGF